MRQQVYQFGVNFIPVCAFQSFEFAIEITVSEFP
jgi:hypothetical protein